MRINNNIMAMNTHRQYGINNSKIAGSTEKLSSGYRINRAGDDAAGLAISEKMRAQIRGLNMASKNSQDAISLVQTAEGALQETHNILQRMRELAVQSGSDTNEQTIDRAALEQEFTALKAEIDDIAGKTRFNDQNLIDGTFQARKMSVRGGAGTVYNTANVNKVLVDAAKYAGAIDINISYRASQMVGVVAGQANDATITLAGGAGQADGVTGATWVGAQTDTYNGMNYVLRSADDGTGAAINFWLEDLSGNTVSSVVNKALTDFNAAGATVNIGFGAFGTLQLTAGGNTPAAMGSVLADTNSTTINFTANDGVTPNAGYREPAKAILQYEGDVIELKAGDTVANFKEYGISLGFRALSDADLASLGDVQAFFATNGTSIMELDIIETRQDGLTIQTGANEGDEMEINIDAMNTNMLNINLSSIAKRTDASKAITEVNNAINQVSTQRAALGALQNRLNHKIANLDTSAENLTAAESRIRDVDMAKEMTAFTKNNILFQASTAMLAQANAAPQGVLQLLG